MGRTFYLMLPSRKNTEVIPPPFKAKLNDKEFVLLDWLS